ncbi:MAG: hypothetical protein NVSMB57_02190 [Actinomycetota bacterium]
MSGLSIEAHYLDEDVPPELDQTYRRTFARLKGLFRARGCTPEEAADLAQEAAMRAYVHVRRWGVSGEGLDPLMNRIARNLLIDRHRRVAPHLVPLDNAAEVSDPCADPPEEVIRRQRAGEVQSAVSELPTRHRTALLYSMDGLSPAEVANQLGIGRNAADALLHRARRSLRDRLSHMGEGALSIGLWMRIRARSAAGRVGLGGPLDVAGASTLGAGAVATAAIMAAMNIFVVSGAPAATAAQVRHAGTVVSVPAPRHVRPHVPVGAVSRAEAAAMTEPDAGAVRPETSFHAAVPNPAPAHGNGNPVADVSPDLAHEQNSDALVGRVKGSTCDASLRQCPNPPAPIGGNR